MCTIHKRMAVWITHFVYRKRILWEENVVTQEQSNDGWCMVCIVAPVSCIPQRWWWCRLYMMLCEPSTNVISGFCSYITSSNCNRINDSVLMSKIFVHRHMNALTLKQCDTVIRAWIDHCQNGTHATVIHTGYFFLICTVHTMSRCMFIITLHIKSKHAITCSLFSKYTRAFQIGQTGRNFALVRFLFSFPAYVIHWC